MLVKMNGISLVEPEGNGIMDRLNDFADSVIEKEVEWILNPIYKMIEGGFSHIIEVLNANSAEIITFGVVGCALAMMFAPVMGSSAGKWLGRIVGILWIGITWRMVI